MICTDKQRAEYLYRSYTAVDGLWFRMVEDDSSFEKALRLDEAVWRVMPKIQARKIKEMLGLGNGLDALKTALLAKFEMEGYVLAGPPEERRDGWLLAVRVCPWLEIMKRAERAHLAPTISSVICPAEMEVWAEEFGPGLSIAVSGGCCRGEEICAFALTAAPPR